MQTNYEVIIIGGSYAGLSAAMALGRASRNTLIIDSNLPCNRHTPHSHNFITQDGETPAAISAKAKEQVMQYPAIQFLKDKALTGTKTEDSFTITTESGKAFTSKKLMFASGVKDIMLPINGLEDCWGISVIHCPYCHGYEVKGQKTAILANGDAAIHYVKLLLQWAKNLTLFTNGDAQFDADQLAKLKEYNVGIVEGKIDKLKHSKGYIEEIIMQNGDVHPFKVMYFKPANEQHCNIPQQLGCELNEFGYIVTDDFQRTTVEGTYAGGDCTTMMRSVANAVAQGSKAGAMINMDLSFEVF
jgi:thioredoxin reductase